jgi:hypothetical protein
MQMLMNLSAPAAAIPGCRIEGYRNSVPRLLRLLGLGDVGGKVARSVAERAPPNVAVATNAAPVGWDEIAGEGRGEHNNMVVIVCGQGDERLFRPERGKPDMLVTFVLLQKNGNLDAAADRRLATARSFSDLFVTTSDVDYVSDLIENLAS